ncbi:MAG: hypothetical protein WB420_24750 [Bradyrhizobium sp.]
MVHRNPNAEFHLDGGNPSAAPQLQAAPFADGLTSQVFADNFPGQPGSAWIGNIGNTDFVTVKNP